MSSSVETKAASVRAARAVVITGPVASERFRAHRAASGGAADALEDHHPRDRLAALLLLRRVDTVRTQVNGKAVDLLLDGEVLDLREVIGVLLLKHGDCAARAGHVDPPEPRIERHHVSPLRHR